MNRNNLNIMTEVSTYSDSIGCFLFLLPNHLKDYLSSLTLFIENLFHARFRFKAFPDDFFVFRIEAGVLNALFDTF